MGVSGAIVVTLLVITSSTLMREEVRKQRNELMMKNGESRRSRSSGRFYQPDETRRAPILLG
jgi:hypothetical protein